MLPQGGRQWPPPEQSRPHLPSPPGACSAHCLSVSWERTRPHSHRRSAPGRLLLLLFFSQCSGLVFFSPRCADLRATFKSRFPGVCSGKAPWAVTQETVTGKTGRTPGGGKREAPRSLGLRPPLGGGPRGYPSHLRRFQAVVCVAGKWGRRQERKMIPWPFPCGPRLLAMFAHPGPPHIIHPSGSLSRTRRHGIVVATSAGRTWGTELQLLTVVCYN